MALWHSCQGLGRIHECTLKEVHKFYVLKCLCGYYPVQVVKWIYRDLIHTYVYTYMYVHTCTSTYIHVHIHVSDDTCCI
jgi:hypothetical protein